MDHFVIPTLTKKLIPKAQAIHAGLIMRKAPIPKTGDMLIVFSDTYGPAAFIAFVFFPGLSGFGFV